MMNTETAFLNCYMLSVDSLPCTDDEFYLIDKFYHHNSLTSDIISFQYFCIQIPENEITDIHLLYGLDYDIINKFRIPIIKRIVDSEIEYWKIDLKYYENYKLQFTDLPSN